MLRNLFALKRPLLKSWQFSVSIISLLLITVGVRAVVRDVMLGEDQYRPTWTAPTPRATAYAPHVDRPSVEKTRANIVAAFARRAEYAPLIDDDTKPLVDMMVDRLWYEGIMPDDEFWAFMWGAFDKGEPKLFFEAAIEDYKRRHEKS